MVHLSSFGPQQILVPMSFTLLQWEGTRWPKLPSGSEMMKSQVVWAGCRKCCAVQGQCMMSCSPWWIMQRDWSQSIPLSVIYAHSDTLTHGRVSTLTLFHCGEMLLIWDFFIVKILFFLERTLILISFFFLNPVTDLLPITKPGSEIICLL